MKEIEEQAIHSTRQRWQAVAGLFFKLGAISFAGPTAHIARNSRQRSQRSICPAALIGVLILLTACSGGPPSAPRSSVGPTAMPGAVEVEIIALNHPPMQPILAQVDGYLWQFGNRVRVTHYDFDAPEGTQFAARKGLSGHIPMVIFINGAQTHTVEGRPVTFEGFPQGQDIGMGAGTWTWADLNAVLKQLTAK